MTKSGIPLSISAGHVRPTLLSAAPALFRRHLFFDFGRIFPTNPCCLLACLLDILTLLVCGCYFMDFIVICQSIV